MRIPFPRAISRLTISVGLAVSFAASLPAQQATQYGPFRITAGRWHDIRLPLRRGECFSVVANGLMQRENVQFGADGYQLQNGNVAGKLYALSGTSSGPVGTSGNGCAVVDGTLELGVLFNPQIEESDARQTNGSFWAWVTAPAGRCSQLNCGFTNNTGTDISGGTGPGNVTNWSPYMEGILAAAYQLGIAEVGALYGPTNDATLRYVDERLRMAKAQADNGRIHSGGINSLIELLAQTRNAASIAPQINRTADAYQQAISRHCVCGGIATNPAWVFNAGRMLAYSEAATYQNWTGAVMYGHLTSLKLACVNARIFPVDGIDALMQMLNAGWQPAQLPSANVGAPRNQLFGAAQQTCVCY